MSPDVRPYRPSYAVKVETSTSSASDVAPRARARLDVLRRPEVAVALLLAAGFWLPVVAGGAAWPVAGALLAALAAYTAVEERRLVPVPAAVVALVAAYAAAGIHAWSLPLSELAAFLIRPLVALAVATLAASAAERRRILVVIVAFAASEIPIAAWQAARNVVDYGRGATIGADAVTGSFGVSQAGVLGLTTAAAAVLVAGAWLAGVVRGRTAVVVAGALLAAGVFSSTRALVAFAPVVGGSIALVAASFRPTRPPLRKLAALAAASCVGAASVYGGIVAIYPDAFVGALSSQKMKALGGARAFGIPQPSVAEPPGTAPAATAPGTLRPVSGVKLLPGRLVQMKLAVSLSHQDGVGTALFGRGPGSSVLDPRYRLAQDVPLPQRTGRTLIGAWLTETGWLGLAAFAALLGWLTLLGRALWARAQAASDRALAAALPGIAALTACGAAMVVILDVRAYSIVFWLLVGLALSAQRELRPRRLR